MQPRQTRRCAIDQLCAPSRRVRVRRVTLTQLQTFTVPAREGCAFVVPKGGSARIIDLEGGQVADVFAFLERDTSEHHSAQHTRAVNDRLFPRRGEPFVSNRRRPLMTIEADETPGVHDMLIAACDADRYRQLGIEEWHASCAENLVTALGDLGYSTAVVPQSINLFMNIPVGRDGSLAWEPAPTEPGAAVTFRALEEIVMVVSACPQDIVPINHCNPTSIGVEVRPPDANAG
jgi:uncharacterized protein YcgI (DUF1989 family)